MKKLTIIILNMILCFGLLTSVSVSATDFDPNLVENAFKIYSIFHSLGIPDVNIAGGLSHFYTECRLDFTTIEGIYSPLYVWSDNKQQAFNDLDSHTQNVVWKAYEGSGVTPNHTGYWNKADGRYYPGVGIGSWTGPNCASLIASAQSLGVEWYNDEFQLAYMIATNPNIRTYTEEAGSAGEASIWFMNKVGGVVTSNSVFTAPRYDNAILMTELIDQNGFAKRKADMDFVNRVFNMASQISTDAPQPVVVVKAEPKPKSNVVKLVSMGIQEFLAKSEVQKLEYFSQKKGINSHHN